MAYSLVPDANNTVGSDLTAMYDNFVALESAQIVDSGSTADGDYWRFEEGLQICKNKLILEYEAATSLYKKWNLPVNFINNSISLSALFNEGSYSPSIDELGTNITSAVAPNGADFRKFRISGNTNFTSGDTIDFLVVAIGRWK